MPIMGIIYLILFGFWKKKRWPIYTAMALLYLLSTPIVAGNFFKLIEGTEPRKTPTEMPTGDAIVVLSGMINQIKSTKGVYPEWIDPDRFFGGIELYKAGKAPKLIFTGGKMPWDTTTLTEGEILKQYALAQGVSDSAILLSSDVQNTSDEANAIRELIGKDKKIILITSAYHMMRSQRLFEEQGFHVIPYKVDWKVNKLNSNTVMDFLPDAYSFRLFNTGYREIIGRLIYFLV